MYKTLISFNELKNHLNESNWLIFDCRFDLSDVDKGRSLYADAHIPGAIYAHLDEHLSSAITADSGRHPLPDMNLFVNWLASCGLTGQTQVIVYDDSYAAISSRLWWLLKCLGHEAVAILDGGWQAWVGQNLTVDHHLPALQSSTFNAEFDDSSIVTTQQVLSNLSVHDFQLIDVRTNERFIGASEPIDPVAGHIPGCINIPLGDNLDENGFFKTSIQLNELYSALNARWSTDKQVYMCGSGVTACHSIFALALAGFELPRLYAGSWSEWIRDPQRPIATGAE